MTDQHRCADRSVLLGLGRGAGDKRHHTRKEKKRKGKRHDKGNRSARGEIHEYTNESVTKGVGKVRN